MILQLTAAENAALKNFLTNCEDAEMLSENEWVLDLYDISSPVSIDLLFEKDGSVRIEGAAALLYDEEMDGWYMGVRVEETDAVRGALSEAGALV